MEEYLLLQDLQWKELFRKIKLLCLQGILLSSHFTIVFTYIVILLSLQVTSNQRMYPWYTSKLHVAAYSFVLHELIVLCDQYTDSMLYAPLITGSKVVDEQDYFLFVQHGRSWTGRPQSWSKDPKGVISLLFCMIIHLVSIIIQSQGSARQRVRSIVACMLSFLGFLHLPNIFLWMLQSCVIYLFLCLSRLFQKWMNPRKWSPWMWVRRVDYKTIWQA